MSAAWQYCRICQFCSVRIAPPHTEACHELWLAWTGLVMASGSHFFLRNVQSHACHVPTCTYMWAKALHLHTLAAAELKQELFVFVTSPWPTGWLYKSVNKTLFVGRYPDQIHSAYSTMAAELCTSHHAISRNDCFCAPNKYYVSTCSNPHCLLCTMGQNDKTPL